jgi:hypothetical protein
MVQIFHTDDHNSVAHKYADLVLKNNPGKYKVYVIGEKPAKVGGLESDIVLKDPSGKKLVLAIEVETNDSLSLEQAEARWKPIAAKAPAFQVVLPKGTLARAKRFCKQLEIKAKFYEY